MRSFKLYLSVVIIFGLLTSCYTKEQRMKKQLETWVRRVKEAKEKDSIQKLLSANDSSFSFIKDDNGISIEKGRVDSFMWMLYAANFENDPLHPGDKTVPKLHPVQCNLLFREKKIFSNDTTEYYFSFFDKDPKISYNLDPYFYDGVGTIKNLNRYMVWAIFKKKVPTTPELSEKFFIKQDLLFRNYLRTYKGEMSEWLRHEAIKRGVIDK